MFVVLTGPARSGKTERLLSQYRIALAKLPPGSALWLSPTWRAAAEVRQRLFDGNFRGCFAPGVMTFEKFAEKVLHDAGLPIRPMTRLMKRELIRQIIDRQTSSGQLIHFRSIAHSGGLIDLVCEFISELKRLEIWPEDFHRACSTRGLNQKDIELAEIYDRYQQALREHKLYDAEGRFWSARDALQKAAAIPNSQSSNLESLIPHPSCVILDGFTDFTRTQHEIIEILARHAETTTVCLPLESEPRRADLFAKPLKTLGELRRRHPNLHLEEIPRPPSAAWPAMSRLEHTLFMDPRGRLPNDTLSVTGLEVIAAARPIGEIELIASRIKHLLVDGEARPGDIAVVFRSTQDVEPLLREVFHRSGIPVVFESGESLDRSPALRALVALLQLDVDDWPFDQALAVLGNSYFQPLWPEWQNGQAAADVERTIRKLQIPRSRDRLMELVREEGGRRKAEGGEDTREGSESKDVERLQTTLATIEHLAQLLDALPERATLPQWADAWQQLAEATGLLRIVQAKHPLPPSAFPLLSADERSWSRLMDALKAGDQLAGWLEQTPPALNRREALDALLDILRSETMGHSGDESGYVRILSAPNIRSLQIPCLFLAGLSEKAFPPPDRDDRMYSEADYARLIEAGLPLVARTERTRDEMLLFYEAVTRASKRLYLSYPALDESVQPLLPSPFLREVEDSLGPKNIPRVERADLRPIPADDEPISQAEYRVKALDLAFRGNVAMLAGLLRDTKVTAESKRNQTPAPQTTSSGPSLLSGLQIIHERQDRDRFGPAEGILTSPKACDRTARRFSENRVFSATDLEDYAYCPFRFFLLKTLGLQPLEDLSLEFDFINRGRVVHDILKTFHQSVQRRLGRSVSPMKLDEAEFNELLTAAIEESLPAESPNPVQAALDEINRRTVVQWMSQYREQYQKYETKWKDFDVPTTPELFEVSFGDKKAAAPSTTETLDFDRDGHVVHIAGRIDRIDLGMVGGESAITVIDYKTGGKIAVTAESVRAGLTLQLPLYSLAATELLLPDRDALPWQAGYWYIRDHGFATKKPPLQMYCEKDGRIEIDPQWEEIRDALGDVVVALVRSMRRGRFPVCCADEHCTGRCPCHTTCRIHQIRSLEKTCLLTASDENEPA